MYRLLFFFSFFLYLSLFIFLFFFFNDTATTEIYTLSLHDALPISGRRAARWRVRRSARPARCAPGETGRALRSEEHTSELQSHSDLVCRLLLEKKKKKKKNAKKEKNKINETRK